MGSRARRSTSGRRPSDRFSKLERPSSAPSASVNPSCSGCRTARATSSAMRSIGRSSGSEPGGSRRPPSRSACGRPSTGIGRTSGGGAPSGRARSATTTKSSIAAGASPLRGVDGTSRDVECREVAKADAPTLVPLFEGFYGRWFGEPVTSQAVQRRIRQAKGIETLVIAERDGKILGFASLRLVPSLDSTPYAELSDLFVAGPYRRQGVGRRLLEFVEKRARERGADRLVLTTGLKNVDAQGFYRASGFVDQALAMKKPLGDDTASGLREIRKPRRGSSGAATNRPARRASSSRATKAAGTWRESSPRCWTASPPMFGTGLFAIRRGARSPPRSPWTARAWSGNFTRPSGRAGAGGSKARRMPASAVARTSISR